ncbi:LuxR C-terminal-related transcriptional regulator [Nocardioides sp.]|uniref:LuxR C-terminal-related transcriptional regulator n=1 Tax=Nocardioides sp. TaxID=35761 RepID=UPI002ED6148F
MATAAVRDAYERRDWRAVVDRLGGDRSALDTDDLVLLSDAAWWLGDSPTAMEISEEVYQRLRADGDEPAAADRALRLAMAWFTRGDLKIGEAWLARARRLASGQPRSALHGYLLYVDAAGDLDLTGDPTPAADAAAELRRLAEEFPDPALGCFALALGGMAAVRAGDTTSGFAQLDEAMLPVLGGQVDPLWSGDIYCTVIHLCDDLADLSRMRSWTSSLARWATPLSETFMYAGVTRIHELQLIAAEGDWDTVERELGDQSANLEGAHGWLAGEGYYTLGEVRRLRGDAAGAEQAFARARELLHEAQPGSALLLRDSGDPEGALAQLREALADQNRLVRARMLLPAVELALAAGDASYAETLTCELEETATWYGTPGLAARADRARAAVLLDAGDPAAAVPPLERAAKVYREQRYRHASAMVHEQLAAAARALGDAERARAEEATAIAIYTRLGARPDLERLSRRELPGGLTEREVEVLRCVAAGASNREVAEALTISEKTVGRHLANIFIKIGVSSRTAAAAWAHEHRL